jgi:aminopeptidase N
MPEKRISIKKNKKVYEFMDSPIMSSYLVCYCIGEFEYIEERQFNTLFRVITTKG